jgi:hypothetical protein
LAASFSALGAAQTILLGSWKIPPYDGLRYNEKAIAAGAQTERRGMALAGEESACGETSPADFSLHSKVVLQVLALLHARLSHEREEIRFQNFDHHGAFAKT